MGLALPAIAALTEAQVADARAALLVEGSLHPMAGRIRLAAALRACNKPPLAAAIDLPALDRRRLIDDTITLVAASERSIAPVLRTMAPGDREQLVSSAAADLTFYQVGYMNGMTAWKLSSPEVCGSFTTQAETMLRLPR